MTAAERPSEADVEALAEVLNRHALARPYGETSAWCVCLTWSIDRTEDRAEDERAYERHVAEHLAATLAAHVAQVRADRDRDWEAARDRLADEWACEPLSNRLDDMTHVRLCPGCNRAEKVRSLSPDTGGVA